MTALTIYPCTLASTTLATANQLLANVTGASNTTRLTKVGTSTGYGEATSQGTPNAWAAGGSTGAPTGLGWLLDSTLLEGSTIAAGNWTPSCRGSVSVGTMTADIIVRWYKRSSGGVYTLIGTQTLTGQAFSTTTAEYTLAAVSLAAVSFGVGDKLYYDTWLNITVNGTGSIGANLQWSMASSSTQGSTQINTVTPGYAMLGSPSFAANSALAEAAAIVAPATPASNSVLVQSNAVILSPATLASNSAVLQSGASLLSSAAAVQSNSLLAASAALASAAAAQAQANSIMASGGNVAAKATIQSNSFLVEFATIVLPVLGSVTVNDSTPYGVTANDKLINSVIVSDA